MYISCKILSRILLWDNARYADTPMCLNIFKKTEHELLSLVFVGGESYRETEKKWIYTDNLNGHLTNIWRGKSASLSLSLWKQSLFTTTPTTLMMPTMNIHWLHPCDLNSEHLIVMLISLVYWEYNLLIIRIEFSLDRDAAC